MAANSTAIACPALAAITVARTAGRRMARSARRARPPSVGKAGKRLKNASERLIHRSSESSGLPAATSRSGTSGRFISAISPRMSPARARLTAGPATAMRSSCAACRASAPVSIGRRWEAA